MANRAARSGRELEYIESHAHGPTMAILKVVPQASQGKYDSMSRGRSKQFPHHLWLRSTGVEDAGLAGTSGLLAFRFEVGFRRCFPAEDCGCHRGWWDWQRKLEFLWSSISIFFLLLNLRDNEKKVALRDVLCLCEYFVSDGMKAD